MLAVMLAGALAAAGFGNTGCSPGEDPGSREARDLTCSGATKAGVITIADRELSNEVRPALIPRAAAFSCDPTEIGSGALVRAALGVTRSAVPRGGTPVFEVKAAGPLGEATAFRMQLGSESQLGTWLPVQFKIPPGIGSPVTLQFVAKGLRELEPGENALGVPQLAWAAPRILRPSQERRPSVVLISLDTLRADRTSLYGYSRVTTPFLERLGKQGAVLDQMVSSYPNTLVSHWTIFTGMYPCRHGVYGGDNRPAQVEVTLAEAFRRAGYLTAAFTEGGYVDASFGFARGFDLYHNGPARNLSEFRGVAVDTFKRAADWVAQNKGSDFFLFVHTYQVHAPYNPPARYIDQFTRGYSGRFARSMPAAVVVALNNGGKLKQDDVDQIGALYDAEIRYLDDVLKGFWKELQSLGVLENAMVIFTSDHGEDLMEHGWLAHGTTLYDPALMVPFLVVWPGSVPGGVRLRCQRGLVDLFPTVVQMVGLKLPRDIDGHSFASDLISGRCTAGEEVFSELRSTPYRRLVGPPLMSVREGGWKLILSLHTGEKELYNIASDGAEAHNLDGTGAEHAAWLGRLLSSYLKRLPPDSARAGGVSPAVRERLRQLGYLQE